MKLAYYLDDSSPYGNFRDEIIDTVSHLLIWDYYFANPEALQASCADAASRGLPLIFGPCLSPAATGLDDRCLAGLDVAAAYWDRVEAVYFDELDVGRARMTALLSSWLDALIVRRLAPCPIWVNFTERQLTSGTGYQSPLIDCVGIEAYADPDQQDAPTLIDDARRRLDRLMNPIGSRPCFVVAQGYDRNGSWTNMESLVRMQTLAYDWAAAHEVQALLIFNYGRPGGTRKLPEIRVEHVRIWQAIQAGRSPQEPKGPPIVPYEEAAVKLLGHVLATDYLAAGRRVGDDDDWVVWPARYQADVDAGMSAAASLAKHRLEWRAALGLPR